MQAPNTVPTPARAALRAEGRTVADEDLEAGGACEG